MVMDRYMNIYMLPKIPNQRSMRCNHDRPYAIQPKSTFPTNPTINPTQPLLNQYPYNPSSK